MAAGLAIRTPDRDLREKKPKERIVPYSDKALHQAMIEWLITTDQVSEILAVVCHFIKANVSFACSRYRPLNTQRLRR